MSDKAEVEIKGVFIYTHLGGSNVERRVADAIEKAGDRREQPDYLTRVIVDEMEKDATGEATGLGIASRSYDISKRVRVHPKTGRVQIINHDEIGKCSINDFVDLYAEQDD